MAGENNGGTGDSGSALSGEELGELARQRLAEMGQTQTWLGEQVAALTGEIQVGQPSVSKWLKDLSSASPQRLFCIEGLLGLRPGTYSRQLGYLPSSAVGALNVLEAIDADPELDLIEAEGLRAHYRAIIDMKRARRREALQRGARASEVGVVALAPTPQRTKATGATKGRRRGGGHGGSGAANRRND